MAEYIEREALLDSICHDTCRIAFCGATNCAFMAKVCSAPVADVAPVVHGRWVTHYRSGTTVAEGVCINVLRYVEQPQERLLPQLRGKDGRRC